jgi:lipopolysaccharide assembly outer membrane protein LptD (OstA)
MVRWLREEDALNSRLSGVGPAIEASGLQSLIVRENGRKVWEFAAERIAISPDHRYATAHNVSRGVMYRNNKPYFSVKAARVRLDQQTRNWQARGQLRAEGPDGLVIESKEAKWTHKTQQLVCEGPVQAQVRDMRINTRGVRYDAPNKQLLCPQPVIMHSRRATMQTQTGTQVVAYLDERRVEFQGGVAVQIASRLPR